MKSMRANAASTMVLAALVASPFMHPHRQSRLFHRIMRRMAATRPMAKVYGVVQQPLDQWVFARSRGRTTASSWLAGVEIAMLTTTGARTGKARTVPLLALRNDGGLIAIASNFGRPQNPSWYQNLCANPRASLLLGGETRHVVAHELAGSERDRGFQLGEEIFPGFTHYARWTDRRIPVLRLETE
jgi:deazaflavin-dependent oxidoreductase (nitroreductase family)